MFPDPPHPVAVQHAPKEIRKPFKEACWEQETCFLHPPVYTLCRKVSCTFAGSIISIPNVQEYMERTYAITDHDRQACVFVEVGVASETKLGRPSHRQSKLCTWVELLRSQSEASCGIRF